MNQAKQNLVDFIVNTYPKRGMVFSTSWTSYSMCETPEETLLCKFFGDQDSLDRDWFKDLPSAIYDLAKEYGAYEKEQEDLFAMFLGDAMRDLLNCHLRE